MAASNGNRRCGAPRPLRLERGVGSRLPAAPRRLTVGQPYRRGATPTPAPLAVAIAPAPTPARTADPRSGPTRKYMLVLLALVAATFLAKRSSAHAQGGAFTWPARAQIAAVTARQPPAEVGPSIAGERPTLVPREHVPIDGGVVLSPAARSPDGSYDLIVHFHGPAAVVEQSVAYAGLGAALAVLELGRGSAVYRRRFETAAAFDQLLRQIDEVVARAGRGPSRLRRIALSSHSAGYGALDAILTRHLADPRLDAVLVSDGIYADFLDPARRQFDTAALANFARLAERAASGELLFSISHSMIEPHEVAGPARTARHLLVHAGGWVEPQAMLPTPSPTRLESVEYWVPAAHRLVPVHDSQIGELRVRGYQGTEREDHQAQLLQMAATVLPDLVERWAR